MGIEKMTFVDINGNMNSLDDVLLICLRSGFFQPEYASRLSEYSVGVSTLMRNPYGALRVKIGETAAQLKLELKTPKPPAPGDIPNRETFIKECGVYLNELYREYPKYLERQKELMDEITSYTSALDMITHVNVSDIDFGNIWDNKFLKIRFGRIPAANFPKLTSLDDKPCEIYKLDETQSFVWCMYFTAEQYRDDIDKTFFALGFERLRVPDYVKGTAEEAMESIRRGLEEEKRQLVENRREINLFAEGEREKFMRIYSAVEFLHTGYELRKYAVSIRSRFHFVGFVLTKHSEALSELLAQARDVVVSMSPAVQSSGRLDVPVKLKNNVFVRPFEMFVDMYGPPSYRDMDPTPFLAYTYTILFGIMFGDMGHGLCVALLGYYLWRKKGVPLGGVMTRIGMSSMFFGFWYGSVFGYEHLLDPVFAVMGFHEKPIEVMHPDTTTKILIAAVGLGAVSIVAAILFNMIMGLRRGDFDRALLSSNGLCGLMFYASVLVGAMCSIAGYRVFTAGYVLPLIALPLAVIFFREPIAKYARMRNKDSMISHDSELLENILLDPGTNIPELFSSPFMTARFGRIPTDSYKKLVFYLDEPFMLYPIKTDAEYIWFIYATAIPNKAEIDAVFHDLYFERIFIPEDDLRTAEDAKAFIRQCVDAGTPPAVTESAEKEEAARPRGTFQKLFPEGLGNFITVTFFEMFEVILSFISNTMSFLRVGGFVLVHAGMMSVVFTLSGMMESGGATVSVMILGNVFVMAMEGLIVGIQVLRLEFYEMFSRFYGSGGDPFRPVRMESYSNAN